MSAITVLAMLLAFTKLHGLGNDFVLIDLRGKRLALSRKLIRQISDRKRGVGFDQLLVLKTSQRAHARMVIYNTDATRAEMCGNGLRAAALYLWTKASHTQKRAYEPLTIETDAGLRQARWLHANQTATSGVLIECEMGVPRLLKTPAALKSGVRIDRKTIHPVCVDVGNPHAVCFAYPKIINQYGAHLETHRAFPKRTNVEFARLGKENIIDVRVWERGVGETEACGTGAVAAVVAAISQQAVKSPVRARFPGGHAIVRWAGAGQPAYLIATASISFSGQLSILKSGLT